MKFGTLAAALLACIPASVFAQDDDFLSALSLILASEKMCELSLSDEKVAAAISKEVDATDIGFADRLNNGVTFNTIRIEGVAGAHKIAHCTAIKSAVQHLKLGS